MVNLDAEVWDRTMIIDLRGVMFGCKHAIAPMIASGGGSIINTSSNASMAGDLGLTAYASAKGGINTLSLSVATAFGKQGIRCNTVSPAHIASPSLAANVPAEVAAALREQCLVPRLGTPQDIANMVLFLASDESVLRDRPDTPGRRRGAQPPPPGGPAAGPSAVIGGLFRRCWRRKVMPRVSLCCRFLARWRPGAVVSSAGEKVTSWRRFVDSRGPRSAGGGAEPDRPDDPCPT